MRLASYLNGSHKSLCSRTASRSSADCGRRRTRRCAPPSPSIARPVGSTIRTWDVNQDLVTDHDRRHKLLRDFVVGENVNKREVAQALRPTLEAFFRVAQPEYFPPGTLLGPFRGLCEQRVGRPNEILNQTDIDELRRLTDYGNRFHHDTNPAYLTQAINDAELLNFAQRTLAFAAR
jgi:hypothetical protein